MAKKNKLRLPSPNIPSLGDWVPRLSLVESTLLDLNGDADDLNPSVSLKYYEPNFECFSAWEKKELSSFSDFVKKLSKHTWAQVVQTGGKLGSKTGLGYTPHKIKGKLPALPDGLSEDLTFFELRVTQVARVHGFRVKSFFFLVWLDHKHRIYPM